MSCLLPFHLGGLLCTRLFFTPLGNSLRGWRCLIHLLFIARWRSSHLFGFCSGKSLAFSLLSCFSTPRQWISCASTSRSFIFNEQFSASSSASRSDCRLTPIPVMRARQTSMSFGFSVRIRRQAKRHPSQIRLNTLHGRVSDFGLCSEQMAQDTICWLSSPPHGRLENSNYFL